MTTLFMLLRLYVILSTTTTIIDFAGLRHYEQHTTSHRRRHTLDTLIVSFRYAAACCLPRRCHADFDAAAPIYCFRAFSPFFAVSPRHHHHPLRDAMFHFHAAML